MWHIALAVGIIRESMFGIPSLSCSGRCCFNNVRPSVLAFCCVFCLFVATAFRGSATSFLQIYALFNEQIQKRLSLTDKRNFIILFCETGLGKHGCYWNKLRLLLVVFRGFVRLKWRVMRLFTHMFLPLNNLPPTTSRRLGARRFSTKSSLRGRCYVAVWGRKHSRRLALDLYPGLSGRHPAGSECLH